MTTGLLSVIERSGSMAISTFALPEVAEREAKGVVVVVASTLRLAGVAVGFLVDSLVILRGRSSEAAGEA